MTPKSIEQAQEERDIRQLKRLSILTDVIYGLIIVRLISLLPQPDVSSLKEGQRFYELFLPYTSDYLVILVGFIMVIIYWNLNNLQTGNLVKTNTIHATVSLAQVFSLLIYLYFLKLDIAYDSPMIVLLLESVFMALAGFGSVYSWYYSHQKKLISDLLPLDERIRIFAKLIPEPAVAVISIPFVFLGPDIWTASWLLLIPAGKIAKWFARKKITQ